MGYAAIGAATGAAVGGSIVSGLVGAASGKGAEVIVSYLRGIKERREGKAVLDLIISFYPEHDQLAALAGSDGRQTVTAPTTVQFPNGDQMPDR
jgi:hypothetical protein